MFNPIYRSCLAPCSSQYHSFSALVNWLRTFEGLHIEILGEKKCVFSSNTQIVSKMLALLASNWESPIKGVSRFVKEAYRILIGLSRTECDLLKTLDFDIVGLLLDQVMKLSWKTKGKYLVLSVALQFIDYGTVSYLSVFFTPVLIVREYFYYKSYHIFKKCLLKFIKAISMFRKTTFLCFL